MTLLDKVFLVLAGLDLICLGVVGWVAVRVLDTLKEGQRRMDPAVREAMALADRGRAMAAHARQDGRSVATRVKSVTQKVKHRVETTKRIAAELRSPARETLATVQGRATDLSRKARALGELGRHLARVKSAAEAAASAARKP